MPTRTALIVVHLSSLDMFAEEYGTKAAEDLAARLAGAVLDHVGPVYIIDQRWTWRGPVSEPRFELVRGVQLQRDIDWMHFDDTRMDWGLFIEELARDLKRDGVKTVVLGGIWYSPEGAGCVSEVQEVLTGRFNVRVNPRLVGCVPMGRA